MYDPPARRLAGTGMLVSLLTANKKGTPRFWHLVFGSRQNIDPWQLAARLTQLPKAQAVKMLASIVEESGSRRWSPSEANEVAVRLIGLLPSQNSFSLAPPSMESLKGYLMIWLLYGIFWGTLAIYAGNPQQRGKDYTDSSAVNAAVSKQARSSLQQPNTD